ncbi:MAG: alpha/beta hydrolase [Lachnospiraceae bacterium]|uniref:Alpha/beta hydrolase n=1 Tax=Candidatus Weimeria bifida TaxID=2599074 RepID=A0A6N7J286_9FIRM|nr:alpha/beta hydrolase [Candidatus Weimeria bifida]RRF96417.1 MAG: alpha/beta hydrolase [Lachnospiraceae bacterium]
MEITVDGKNIRYKVTGSGKKTAVILQGWGTDMKLYDSIAADISDEYRVIQFNLPGFSDSEEPSEPWGVEEFAAWFNHFMQALEIRKAVLIGHSFGGRIMIWLGSLSKDEISFAIDKLVLVDAAGIQREKTPKQKRSIARYHFKRRFFHLPLIYYFFKDAVDIWQGQQGSADYRNSSPMMKKCMVKAVNDDLTYRLPDIPYETCLIWGDQDTATPLLDGKDMERLMPNAALHVLTGTDHFSFLRKPQEFNEILRSFLC